MLKYYHVDHRSKWLCVPEEQIPANAKYESVLYVQYKAEDAEAAGEEQGYWGPFYIDIDVAQGSKEESIAIAMADARDILHYMRVNYGLTEGDYNLYASGGKGFHIEVNPYLYSTKKFMKALPLRYRIMAGRLAQETKTNIDMGVYSSGKGRQWRRTNVQRENGSYKVLLDSLDGLTSSDIIELTKKPGKLPEPFSKGKVNELLASWFNSTKKAADFKTTTEPVPVEKISSLDTPECVKKLGNNEDVKTNVNSNLIAMQAISYGIAKGWSIDQIISYNSGLILNYRSSQYKTPEAFKDHFRALYDYSKENSSKFAFGCKMMLSCVDGVDCDNCQIKIGVDTQAYEGIYVKDGGYYLADDQPDRPGKKLTNFTVSWDAELIPFHEGGYADKGESRNIYTVHNEHQTKVVTLPGNVIDTKAGIQKFCDSYLSYFGTERDLPMLKLAISHMSNPTRSNIVGYTGLVWYEDEWHFTTKEMSISLNMTMNLITTEVDSQLATSTRLNFKNEDAEDAEIEEITRALLDINREEISTPMLLWFLNCFFNPHVQFANTPSPSLFVTGMHGSGKTQSMLQFQRLFAPVKNSFPSISTTTAFAMNKYASATNLMPLIFDEYKPSMNASKNNEVGQVSQAIRASYDKSYESRGTQFRNIEQTPFYAPLAIIGEQQSFESAVTDRIILLQLDSSFHDKANTAALEKLRDLNTEALGAMFLEFAMQVTPKQFVARRAEFDKSLQNRFGKKVDNRPRQNMASLQATLSYFKEFIALHTPNSESVIEKLDAAFEIYLKSNEFDLNSVMHEVKNLDDIGKALINLNDIADLADSSLQNPLLPGRHYIVDRGILYIDVEGSYKLLKNYIRQNNIEIFLTDRVSFITQLGHKSYAMFKPRRSDIIITDKPRIVVGIDPLKALKMNIRLDNFKGVSYD